MRSKTKLNVRCQNKEIHLEGGEDDKALSVLVLDSQW